MMTMNAAATDTLQKGIAEFYDESSGVWEDIWGDHMHHGFYEPGSDVSLSDHRAAQIRMIEESLLFASLSDDSVQKPRNIIDVGCGIGGSSRYLARKYGAKCKGITLSPVQAQRAQELAAAQGLDGKVSFQVADALNQPFPDGEFDLVWSMESGEHMPDKTKFVNELARVAAPGGRIIIVTWCHRDLSPSEESLRPEEKQLLKKICDAYYLPAWCSTADYVKLLQSLSLEDIKAADWSQNVAPFWPAVIKSALSWKGITSLFRTGNPDLCTPL
ncbi:UNVERIFIED_CONTAM: putative tocopherol O-methyltransferase, chloroplastic [Sesamum calycinum]|uniref:Tocopherol O-methyltransferase, chloroplastic n=1 Tax=Sesamum calycinum TaxID=2727403 RepID=A0AAW2NX23_9LAMI